ncbi:MAG: hypothetical protein JWO22_3305 [Frankiales bacterium]|nr:hypothetical protein [Frankiales bacterium]
MTALTDRHQAVLITLRKDGTPQSSNIAFVLADGIARVSVTDDRAKTRSIEAGEVVVVRHAAPSASLGDESI